MRLLLLLATALMLSAAIGKGHQMLVLRRLNDHLSAIIAELWKERADERCPHCGKLPTDSPF